MSWLEKHSTPIIAALLILILIGGALFFYRQAGTGGLLEITLAQPSGEIEVYVAGAVVHEGVYVLEEGDRVEDAILAAGGYASDADLTLVNPAARLYDGDQVHIYRMGEASQKVNINTADAWLLEALPGIGEILAQRIVAYRTDKEPFLRIEDLQEVEGIYPSTYDKVKDFITVQ